MESEGEIEGIGLGRAVGAFRGEDFGGDGLGFAHGVGDGIEELGDGIEGVCRVDHSPIPGSGRLWVRA